MNDKFCKNNEHSIVDFELVPADLFIMDLQKYLNKYSEIVSTPHRIKFNQILLIISGEGLIRVDEHICLFEGGTLFAISKDQVESIVTITKMNGYVIYFSEQFINRFSWDIQWMNNLKLFHPASPISKINLTQDDIEELLIFIIRMECELIKGADIEYDELLLNLLKTFLSVCERFLKPPGASLNISCGNRARFSEFNKKLEEDYDKNRSVQYYADCLNITPRKLNQASLDIIGKSAKRVIEERVLLEIKRQLLYTSFTVKEIGFSLGFSDPTNFNKFFKKYAGCTPTEFRLSNSNGRF